MEVKEQDLREHLSGHSWPRGAGRDQSRPRELLLFELIDGLLLLVDLVPEPGQLPVMGLPVTLHLQLQGLLQTTPPQAQSQVPQHQLSEGQHSPARPAIPTPSLLTFTSSASCVSGSLSFKATSCTVSIRGKDGSHRTYLHQDELHT